MPNDPNKFLQLSYSYPAGYVNKWGEPGVSILMSLRRSEDRQWYRYITIDQHPNPKHRKFYIKENLDEVVIPRLGVENNEGVWILFAAGFRPLNGLGFVDFVDADESDPRGRVHSKVRTAEATTIIATEKRMADITAALPTASDPLEILTRKLEYAMGIAIGKPRPSVERMYDWLSPSVPERPRIGGKHRWHARVLYKMFREVALLDGKARIRMGLLKKWKQISHGWYAHEDDDWDEEDAEELDDELDSMWPSIQAWTDRGVEVIDFDIQKDSGMEHGLRGFKSSLTLLLKGPQHVVELKYKEFTRGKIKSAQSMSFA